MTADVAILSQTLEDVVITVVSSLFSYFYAAEDVVTAVATTDVAAITAHG